MKKRDLNRRKAGLKQVQMYAETAARFKERAAKVGVTIPRYFVLLLEGLDGAQVDTEYERENDTQVRKGTFARTGRGEAKASGEFRELDIYSKKDQEYWMTWDEPRKLKYIEWWEKLHPGRFWEGDAAFFPTSLRC